MEQRNSTNDNQQLKIKEIYTNKKLVISFDIDNTLIPYSNEFETEEKTLLSKMLGAESLRAGTISLFKELENRGHLIWIYTTSYRSVFKLKKTFKLYGLHPSRIINGAINQKLLKKHHCKASKNPKLFGIDIHVDDSEGVRIEGERHHFKTIILDTNDKEWGAKVLREVEVFNRF